MFDGEAVECEPQIIMIMMCKIPSVSLSSSAAESARTTPVISNISSSTGAILQLPMQIGGPPLILLCQSWPHTYFLHSTNARYASFFCLKLSELFGWSMHTHSHTHTPENNNNKK